jgi:hypothetical protein
VVRLDTNATRGSAVGPFAESSPLAETLVQSREWFDVTPHRLPLASERRLSGGLGVVGSNPAAPILGRSAAKNQSRRAERVVRSPDKTSDRDPAVYSLLTALFGAAQVRKAVPGSLTAPPRRRAERVVRSPDKTSRPRLRIGFCQTVEYHHRTGAYRSQDLREFSATRPEASRSVQI